MKMATYKIVYRAGAYAGGCVGETTGDAETAEEALTLFWADVDSFALCVAEVISVTQITA